MKPLKEKRQRTKVLPLPLWAENEAWAEKNNLPTPSLDGYRKNEIEPVFNRNGLYFQSGKGAWLELDGKAYAYDTKYFFYELGLWSIKPLRACEFAAYLELFKAKLMSKPEKKKFLFYCEYLSLWQAKKESASAIMDMNRRAQEFIKEYLN